MAAYTLQNWGCRDSQVDNPPGKTLYAIAGITTGPPGWAVSSQGFKGGKPAVEEASNGD